MSTDIHAVASKFYGTRKTANPAFLFQDDRMNIRLLQQIIGSSKTSRPSTDNDCLSQILSSPF